MKRTHLVMVVAFVLATGLLLGAQGQTTKWEYARLSYGRFADSYSWTVHSVSAESKSMSGLRKKLQIETAPNKDDALTIINWAGSQGWELIEVIRYPDYAIAWFKRSK